LHAPRNAANPWTHVRTMFELRTSRDADGGTYTAPSGQRSHLRPADMPLTVLTCDESIATHNSTWPITDTPCRFPPRRRASRSLPSGRSRSSSSSSDLRSHERPHQGQQRWTCGDAGSWTHACLSALTRFCSSTAHFRVQTTRQLRNPGGGPARFAQDVSHCCRRYWHATATRSGSLTPFRVQQGSAPVSL
jgi:hypothetical protein